MRSRLPNTRRVKSLCLNGGHGRRRGWLRPLGRSSAQLLSTTVYWLAPVCTRVTSTLRMSPCTSVSSSPGSLWARSSPSCTRRTWGAKKVRPGRAASGAVVVIGWFRSR